MAFKVLKNLSSVVQRLMDATTEGNSARRSGLTALSILLIGAADLAYRRCRSGLSASPIGLIDNQTMAESEQN